MEVNDFDYYTKYLDGTMRAFVSDCMAEEFSALKRHVPEAQLDGETYERLLAHGIDAAAEVGLIAKIRRAGCLVALCADEAFFEQVRWRLIKNEGFGTPSQRDATANAYRRGDHQTNKARAMWTIGHLDLRSAISNAAISSGIFTLPATL